MAPTYVKTLCGPSTRTVSRASSWAVHCQTARNVARSTSETMPRSSPTASNECPWSTDRIELDPWLRRIQKGFIASSSSLEGYVPRSLSNMAKTLKKHFWRFWRFGSFRTLLDLPNLYRHQGGHDDVVGQQLAIMSGNEQQRGVPRPAIVPSAYTETHLRQFLHKIRYPGFEDVSPHRLMPHVPKGGLTPPTVCSNSAVAWTDTGHIGAGTDPLYDNICIRVPRFAL